MKNLTIVLFALSFMASSALAEAIFSDSFESGSLAAASNNIFKWRTPNRTSIVTMEPNCNGLNSGDPTSIYNGDVICNGPITGKDWRAFTGKNSLRFRYPAGEYMAEQRFSLGQHMPEFWLRYRIRVPINFLHGSKNNKFLAIWVDSYDTSGDVTWQTRPDGQGGAVLVYQDGGVTSGEADPKPFISIPNDRGKWMEIIVHYISASGPKSNDGLIELYRKWMDRPGYELIHRKTNASTFEPGAPVQGISHGYFMGWANDPYHEETEWLIDDVQIYNSLKLPMPPRMSGSSHK